MAAPDLTHDPGAEDFRALARSSPWRFRTLHLTHRQTGYAATHQPDAVEAWLDRPAGRVTVRYDGEVEVSEGVPYSRSALTFGWDADGRPTQASPPPAPARDQGVVLRTDGLVLSRPDGWALDHGDPMWGNYQWTAMLDPAELADGSWAEAEHEAGLPESPDAVRPVGVEVSDVEEVEHRGRRTWRAVCRPVVDRYDPRCGCCPLLDSLASRLVEYGPDDPTMSGPSDELPTAYLVNLDVQTGIVVDVTALDGTDGSGFTNQIHAVDEALTPPSR